MTKKSTETEKEEIEVNPENENNTTEQEGLKCGIIMPISAIDGYNSGHWKDVLDIITDSATAAGFTPRMVSYKDEVSVIQATIVRHIYYDDIIVCDVSAKNPNVMFELGLRLAFDKPTVIIKDDKTDYSFDTSPLEHLTYPRDLRYPIISEFKAKLRDKVKKTYEMSLDKTHSTFLKHFGPFKIAELQETEIGLREYIIKEFAQLKSDIPNLIRNCTPLSISDPIQANRIMVNIDNLLNTHEFIYGYKPLDIIISKENLEMFTTDYINQYVDVTLYSESELNRLKKDIKMILEKKAYKGFV